MNLPVQSTIPLLFVVSFAHFFVVALVWGYLPIYNPITNWLFSCCAGEPYFKPVIYIHDILLNIFFSFPVAWLISILRPRKTMLYLACAVLPSFVYSHYHLFSPDLQVPISKWVFVPGAAMQLAMIPLTYFILTRINAHRKSRYAVGR